MAYDLNLKDKVAVVTGASRGIGRAIATVLAAEGVQLALTSQSLESIEAISSELHIKYGVTCLSHGGDVSDPDSVQMLYQKVHQQFGTLDILVSNAGIVGDGLLGMMRDEDMLRVLEVNVLGTFHHIQSAARLMRRKKSGSIIVMSSIMGCKGIKGQSLYSASKAALIGVTLSASKELGEDGIRVNALAPGMIETDMTKNLSSQIKSQRMEAIALGRYGKVEDVADVALFLASDLSRYVSGQVIGVDGGMVI